MHSRKGGGPKPRLEETEIRRLPELLAPGPQAYGFRGNAWTRPGNHVGNGAFKLKSWQPNREVVVEKSPTYWDAATVPLDAAGYVAEALINGALDDDDDLEGLR